MAEPTAPARYVRMLRTFALVLIACGLFVQSIAHASAIPQDSTAVGGECTEMRMAAEPSPAHDSDGPPCENMRIECLVTHGCISPLALVDDAMAPRDRLAVLSLFAGITGFPLASTARVPETPPPQARA